MRLLLATLLLMTAATGSAMAMPDKLTFDVMRNGDRIGSHVVAFAETGDETRVDIRTDVAVKILFVTAYRFEHRGTELWRDGRIVGYESRTDDDGSDKRLQVRPAGDGLAVDGSAGRWTADADIMPASLWNPQLVVQKRLLNTLDGSVMAVRVQDAGMDQVEVGGREVPAHRYRITGDLDREVWYDAEGVLSHVRFAGQDGSQIDYVRR